MILQNQTSVTQPCLKESGGRLLKSSVPQVLFWIKKEATLPLRFFSVKRCINLPPLQNTTIPFISYCEENMYMSYTEWSIYIQMNALCRVCTCSTRPSHAFIVKLRYPEVFFFYYYRGIEEPPGWRGTFLEKWSIWFSHNWSWSCTVSINTRNFQRRKTTYFKCWRFYY